MPGGERAERHEPRVVLVAQRQVQDEVLVARDAELRELVGETAARLGRLAAPGLRLASLVTARALTGPCRYAGSLPAGRAPGPAAATHEHRLDLDPRRLGQRRDLVGRARRDTAR